MVPSCFGVGWMVRKWTKKIIIRFRPGKIRFDVVFRGNKHQRVPASKPNISLLRITTVFIFDIYLWRLLLFGCSIFSGCFQIWWSAGPTCVLGPATIDRIKLLEFTCCGCKQFIGQSVACLRLKQLGRFERSIYIPSSIRWNGRVIQIILPKMETSCLIPKQKDYKHCTVPQNIEICKCKWTKALLYLRRPQL